jgi:hypothetical protein
MFLHYTQEGTIKEGLIIRTFVNIWWVNDFKRIELIKDARKWGSDTDIANVKVVFLGCALISRLFTHLQWVCQLLCLALTFGLSILRFISIQDALSSSSKTSQIWACLTLDGIYESMTKCVHNSKHKHGNKGDFQVFQHVSAFKNVITCYNV